MARTGFPSIWIGFELRRDPHLGHVRAAHLRSTTAKMCSKRGQGLEMRKRRFDGPVVTLADACEADYLVIVTCGHCGRGRQMHPYGLLGAHRRLTNAPLNASLPGFLCKFCRNSVSVTITCTFTRPGGW